MERILLIAFFGIALVVSGVLVYRGDSSPAAIQVAFAKIADGLHAGVDERVNYVVTSPGELALLWELIQEKDIPIPPIDFSKNYLLAMFAGQVPNPGYTIGVSKVIDTPEKRLVSITLTQPGANCILSQVVTSPYELALVPKTDLKLTHDDVATVKDCE